MYLRIILMPDKLTQVVEYKKIQQVILPCNLPFNNTKNRSFTLNIMVRLSYSIRILEKRL